jgi:hypothetical protein
MIFLFALLSLADEFEEAADKIKFPPDEVQREWSMKGETQRKLVNLITDRSRWAKAFETIQNKLGLGPGKIDIDVVFRESDEKRLADSKGRFGFGTVRFNMKQLVPHQKRMDDIEAERSSGKLAPVIIPGQGLDGILTHELTHVLSGPCDETWVAEGLATYAAGEEYFLYAFTHRGGRVETIDRPLNEQDVYPRGLSFFRWMEKEHGSDTVRDFAVRAASGNEKTKTIAADVLGSSWEHIVLREKDWSTEYLAGFKTIR